MNNRNVILDALNIMTANGGECSENDISELICAGYELSEKWKGRLPEPFNNEIERTLWNEVKNGHLISFDVSYSYGLEPYEKIEKRYIKR